MLFLLVNLAMNVGASASNGRPMASPHLVSIRLASDKVLSVTQPTYASWNIDSSCNRGFHRANFSNPNLLAAAKGLAPSRLRFGGSGNDNLVYGLSPGSPECADVQPTDCGYTTPGCLNATQWENLYAFANASGSDFIFGVAFGNAQGCSEGAAYVWNASNAATLLSYLSSHGQNLWGFELGNEVNNNGGPPCNFTAPQQAAALITFAEMVKKWQPNAVLIGPDTGYRNWQDWLTSYLPLVAAKPGMLHAVTHHVYPAAGKTSFNNPEFLDRSLAEITWYTKTVHTLAPGSQVWAGEDGPIGGGDSGTCGSNSICSTYASAVWYADDLANRALHGFVQYQRQSLFGGAYGLTDSIVEHPQSALGSAEALLLRPGYWVNFLWKRVLGQSVYNVTSNNSFVRAYGFSGAAPSRFAAQQCATPPTVKQLLLINLSPDDAIPVLLEDALSYSSWTLAPPKNRTALDPFSQRVLLNGELLPELVDGEGTAAFLEAIPAPAVNGSATGGQTLLPPLSVSFFCYVPAAQESSATSAYVL